MSSQSHRVSRKPQRGLALIGVVGMLLVFIIFVGAMMVQLANEMNSVKRETISNGALAAADAGVRTMVEQIETALQNNQKPPASVLYIYPEPGASPSTTSYTATVTKTWPVGGVVYYLITSTGTVNNGFEATITRTVRALAISQPISGFSSFSNYEINQYGNPVWYLPGEYFDGPVYSGGPMRIMYAGTPSATATPIFGATVTTANNPVWNPGAPQDQNEWDSVVSGGQSSFNQNPTGLGLPQTANNVAVASQAWAGNNLGKPEFPNGFPPDAGATAAPVPPGVYIDGFNSSGADAATSTQPTDTTGIFVNVVNTSGKILGGATITSSVSGNTDTLVIKGPWSGGPYTVTINYTDFNTAGDCSGTTTVTHASNSHTFTGTPCGAPGTGVTNTGNGAVFVDGNTQLGTGVNPTTTLEGQFTLAAPDYLYTKNNTNNDITVLGSVLYDNQSAAYDKLALWANNVILGTNAVGNLTIDASIIAGYPTEPSSSGALYNAFCGQNGCSKVQGNLTINGGVIENERGAVGEDIGGTYWGFKRFINFDSRFTTSPPPFNPTTGVLNIIAWDDLGS